LLSKEAFIVNLSQVTPTNVRYVIRVL